MMKNCKLMVFLILSVWCSWINATLDTIIIDQGQDDPVKVAVVPFKMSGDLEEAINLSDIIAFDLIRSGQFDPLPSENMLSLPSNAQEVFFRDWRILKTDYLVIGVLQRPVIQKFLFFLSYIMLLMKERWREGVFSSILSIGAMSRTRFLIWSMKK